MQFGLLAEKLVGRLTKNGARFQGSRFQGEKSLSKYSTRQHEGDGRCVERGERSVEVRCWFCRFLSASVPGSRFQAYQIRGEVPRFQASQIRGEVPRFQVPGSQKSLKNIRATRQQEGGGHCVERGERSSGVVRQWALSAGSKVPGSRFQAYQKWGEVPRFQVPGQKKSCQKIFERHSHAAHRDEGETLPMPRRAVGLVFVVRFRGSEVPGSKPPK